MGQSDRTDPSTGKLRGKKGQEKGEQGVKTNGQLAVDDDEKRDWKKFGPATSPGCPSPGGSAYSWPGGWEGGGGVIHLMGTGLRVSCLIHTHTHTHVPSSLHDTENTPSPCVKT